MKKIFSFLSLFIAISAVTYLSAQCFIENIGGTMTDFIIPTGTTSIDISAIGADGGDSGNTMGGAGGTVNATFTSTTVSPGEVIRVIVGSAGSDGPVPPVGQAGGSGGGGGGTAVINCGINANCASGILLVVAGAGGGARRNSVPGSGARIGPGTGDGGNGNIGGGAGGLNSDGGNGSHGGGGMQASKIPSLPLVGSSPGIYGGAGGVGFGGGGAGGGGGTGMGSSNYSGGGGGGYSGGNGGTTGIGAQGGTNFVEASGASVFNSAGGGNASGGDNTDGFVSITCTGASAPLMVSSFEQAMSINEDGFPPHATAILDIQSTIKGVLIPRMNSAQRMAITTPDLGLLVYDVTTGGFWYYNGGWQSFNSSISPPSVIVDTDVDTKIQTEASADEDVIRFDIAGAEKMALMQNSNGAARLELFDDAHTTAVGQWAGENNNPVLGTSGDENTFLGFQAGQANTDGRYNTFLGSQAGQANTIGQSNTANGTGTLYFNTTGDLNTANGAPALAHNTTGFGNTANGVWALDANTTGDLNTANGTGALFSNFIGNSNTALGHKCPVQQH